MRRMFSENQVKELAKDKYNSVQFNQAHFICNYPNTNLIDQISNKCIKNSNHLIISAKDVGFVEYTSGGDPLPECNVENICITIEGNVVNDIIYCSQSLQVIAIDVVSDYLFVLDTITYDNSLNKTIIKYKHQEDKMYDVELGSEWVLSTLDVYFRQ